MKTFRRVALPGVVLLALGAACYLDWGRGDGDITGVLCLRTDPTDCREDDRFGAHFFALERFGNRALIVIRSAEDFATKTDDLTIRVLDTSLMDAAVLDTPLAIGREANVQAAFSPRRTREQGYVAVEPAPEATITFRSFGVKRGQLVRAELDLPLVARAEDGQVSRGRLVGWFSFHVADPPRENKDVIRPPDGWIDPGEDPWP